MGNTLETARQTCEDMEEPEEDQDVSNFTCEICIEPVSSNKRFKNSNKCRHHWYCLDCIEKYIQAKIEDCNASEIKCPSLECDEILDPLTCRSFLSANVFVRWCDVLCESALSQQFQRVYCPFRDCSSLILNECGGKIGKTNCPNCKMCFCFECTIPWQNDDRCNQLEQFRDANDILFYELVEKKKWKRCPACSHGVELRSGCSLVLCRCGAYFCHACGRKCRGGQHCWCEITNDWSTILLVVILFIFVVGVIVAILHIETHLGGQGR